MDKENKDLVNNLIRERRKFYQRIMTFTIRYGVLRADCPVKEDEMTDLENEMRDFIQRGLGLKGSEATK